MGSSAGPLLFGQEVEFGFAASDARGRRLDPRAAAGRLLMSVGEKHEYLGIAAHRMFMANGSLMYVDCGHPEFATAEVSSPFALVEALRAGECMFADAARALEDDADIGGVNLFRTTVDYTAVGRSWGAHESYLSRNPPREFAASVVPFLASRIVITGVGGFENTATGNGFVISPRAFHLLQAVGGDSQTDRAIFDLRDERLAGKEYHRVHLICGEPNCCELALVLKVGATALVLALADAGVDLRVASGWMPRPVSALHRFSRDTSCKLTVTAAGGQKYSAIDIQRHYLELVEEHQDASFMPEWAAAICTKWRRVLDMLEQPQSLVGTLDWVTKLALFKHHAGPRWEELPVWEKFMRDASVVLETGERLERKTIQDALSGCGRVARQLQWLIRCCGNAGLDWEGIEEAQALRDELCEMDVRYGQLYPRGIYLELEDAGVMQGRQSTVEAVAAAVAKAPEVGRARLRGDWIRRLAGTAARYECDWTAIAGETTFLDLKDPFVMEAEWRPITPQRRRSGRRRVSNEDFFDIPAFLRRQAD